MWALLEDGQVSRVIRNPVELTINGVTHPRSIFTKWSKTELAAVGIKPYRVEGVDDRYCWQGEATTQIGDEVVVSYACIARDLDALKAAMKAQVKQLAASLLAKTDWMVIRASEGGTAVSDDVTAYRAAVREASNTKEAEIEALADLDAVKAYEAKPFVEVRKIKHSSEDGTETYGPETEEVELTISMVTGGWPVDPLAEVDPAFVSLTAV